MNRFHQFERRPKRGHLPSGSNWVKPSSCLAERFRIVSCPSAQNRRESYPCFAFEFPKGIEAKLRPRS
jgi:hypothetical protein